MEKTKAKICRNSGKQYVSSSKIRKIFEAKKIGKTCPNTCKLQCTTKIKEDRQKYLKNFGS